MARLQVFKFGGTSVGGAEEVRLAIARVRETTTPLVTVVSAMGGVTDLLLEAARAAAAGRTADVLRNVETFHRRHQALIGQLVGTRGLREELETLLQDATEELGAICQSIQVLQELTPRTLDAVASRGERVLARIFAAGLVEAGADAEYVDATEVLFTRRTLDSLWPDEERCEKECKKRLRPLLARGAVVIVPGFIATGPDGHLVTLGRGGSDFSASLLARAMAAGSVTLFKDVDGLMTADPKAVPDARVLPEVHYREAAELAYYGAKVLHPRTMIPLLERGIPLHLRNSFNPGFPGTRIAGDVKAGAYPVKALTAIHGQALLSVEGKGMLGVPGIAGRTFSAVAQAGLSVSMISQASSEASICFVLPASESEAARKALEKTFAAEIAGRFIDAVRVEKPVALVAVVGLGMAGTPGIAARTTAPLAREKINILSIAQGSSELNITLAIREGDSKAALQALHREFQLDKLRPLPDTHGHETSVVLFGLGQIGRALTRQLLQQDRYFRHGLGQEVRVVCTADRSGLVVAEQGFGRDDLEAMLERKSQGRPLARRSKGEPKPVGAELARALWPVALPRPVFVDATALDDAPVILEALRHGFHVVLANKKPLAAPQEQYDALFAAAREQGVQLRYEATVGAGLPVLDTLRKLEEAGDRVQTVLGALSGTLGYVLTRLEEGMPFSEAVCGAHQLGYTEPDPRDDLSGTDVARKALILARSIGRKLDLTDIAIEPLFPARFGKLSPEQFLEHLPELDEEMAARVAAAQKKQQVLRYLARIDRRGVRVGLEAVPEGSPSGRLKGLDNQVVLFTDRYRNNPLVVTGPGAGAEVTAAGVLNDILAIAGAAQRQGQR